ncbi:MAG: hypothetical protein M3R36_00345 [Bacteroidota bacterium]|nr:hypothetical protein [Bacteroidota bacterium]
MKETTRLTLLIVFIFLNVQLLSAHQGNHNKSSNEVPSSDVSFVKKSAEIKENNCGFRDAADKCCCCISGTCFRFENNCRSDRKIVNSVFCKGHCDDDNYEGNDLINQNLKVQNLYKTYSKNNFSIPKEIISNCLQISQNAIKQNTPTYISIQSFLI